MCDLGLTHGNYWAIIANFVEFCGFMLVLPRCLVPVWDGHTFVFLCFVRKMHLSVRCVARLVDYLLSIHEAGSIPSTVETERISIPCNHSPQDGGRVKYTFTLRDRVNWRLAWET